MNALSVVLAICLLCSLPQQVTSNLGGVLCRLPKDSGYQCGMSVPHSAYYFDVAIGECIEFRFHGCGGNQNRFTSKEECVSGCGALAKCGKGLPLMDFAGNLKHCEGDRIPCPGGYECIGKGMESVCCRKADRICAMSVDMGKTCGTVTQTRYFYDGGANLCRPFAYLGCGGNENNFKTKGECLKFCARHIYCLKGEPWPDRYAVSRIASCHTDRDCPHTYTCVERSNRHVCCPSVDFVCGSPFDSKLACRRTEETQVGWTFNVKKGQCDQLDVADCADQLNYFASLEQCSDFCIGTCPEGKEIHINPFSNQPQMCNHVLNEGCPLGFECLKRSNHSAVCCKMPPSCPAPESLVLSAMGTGKAVRCVPETDHSCPSGYTCQLAKNKEFICCTPPLNCPDGMSALREDFNQPHICTPGVAGSCPVEGYHCVKAEEDQSTQPQKYLCCKPQRKCLTMASPSRDPNAVSHLPKCYLGNRRCPLGDLPLMRPENHKPYRCNVSNVKACPPKYVCNRLMDGSYACCPIPKDQQQLCRAPIALSNGTIIPCKDETDTDSCRVVKGVCRRTIDMNYNCCRSK